MKFIFIEITQRLEMENLIVKSQQQFHKIYYVKSSSLRNLIEFRNTYQICNYVAFSALRLEFVTLLRDVSFMFHVYISSMLFIHFTSSRNIGIFKWEIFSRTPTTSLYLTFNTRADIFKHVGPHLRRNSIVPFIPCPVDVRAISAIMSRFQLCG